MSAIIMGAVTPSISTFNIYSFVDNAGVASYRNYLESRTTFTQGKQSFYVAGTTPSDSFFQTYAHWDGDPAETELDNVRYATSIDGTVSWGDIYASAPKWAGARGSTLIFVNNASSITAIDQLEVNSVTFNGSSITPTNRGPGTTHTNTYIGAGQYQRYYTFSSSDPAYNLSGATVGATFTKNSVNDMSMQLIVGLPGEWDFVKAVSLGGNRSDTLTDTFDITGLQKNDVIFLTLTGDYDNINTYHDHSLTNATQKGCVLRSRWKDNLNWSMHTVDADGTVTVSVDPYTTSPFVDAYYDGAGYIVMRYAG